MNNIKLLLIAGLLCPILNLYSQDVREYKTQEYNQNHVVNQEKFYQNKREIERAYKDFLKNGEVTDVNVNLIFHNLYASSQERIPQAKFDRQIEILNENFSSAKYPYPSETVYHEKFETKYCENTRINFCLVSQHSLSSKNLAYNPINYVPVSNSEWSANNDMKNPVGGHPVVLPELLINIWVVNLRDNIAGYAQFPGGDQENDGIVIDYELLRNIDSPIHVSRYNEGKSLVHLIANYLNVNDLWNETVPCGDDGVADTPIHNAPNFSCYESLHLTTCESRLSVEMLNNFMDATPDACQSYFTSGQMMRMQSILSKEGARNGLTETGCKSNFKNDEIAESRKSNSDHGFVIFPNPNNGQFSVEFFGLPDATSGDLSIVDINGKKIMDQKVSDVSEIFSFNINADQMNQLYFVKFRSTQGETIINKLIINQ